MSCIDCLFVESDIELPLIIDKSDTCIICDGNRDTVVGVRFEDTSKRSSTRTVNP